MRRQISGNFSEGHYVSALISCGFTEFAALHSGKSSRAVGSAPDTRCGKKERDTALYKELGVGDASEIAHSCDSEDAEYTECCHNFEYYVENICSFHFISSFLLLGVGVF